MGNLRKLRAFANILVPCWDNAQIPVLDLILFASLWPPPRPKVRAQPHHHGLQHIKKQQIVITISKVLMMTLLCVNDAQQLHGMHGSHCRYRHLPDDQRRLNDSMVIAW